MFWFVVLGVLAAFGALCAVYVAAVACFPKLLGAALVCRGQSQKQELACISRHRRLYELGLLKCPLIVVESTLSEKEQQLFAKKHPYLVFYTRAQYAARFSGENSHAGIGDPTGHHPDGGVSEL